MSGRRLLDLAAIVNASRGISEKHIALRTRQLDVYNRSSTLAKVFRGQTARVTDTLRAASIIVARLNETGPQWATEDIRREDTRMGKPQPVDPVPSRDTAKDQDCAIRTPNVGLEQDHFYNKSRGNSAVDRSPNEDLEIRQENEDCLPLPDGSILPSNAPIDRPIIDYNNHSNRHHIQRDGILQDSPYECLRVTPALRSSATDAHRPEAKIPSITTGPVIKGDASSLNEGHDQDSFYRPSKHSQVASPSLPSVEIPKHPSESQVGDQTATAGQINSDSFYTTSGQVPQTSTLVETLDAEEVPQDVNLDIFYSPRVAHKLGINASTPMLQPTRNAAGDIIPIKKSPGPSDLSKTPGTYQTEPGQRTTPTIRNVSAKAPLRDQGTEDLKISDVTMHAHAKLPPPYELRESQVPSSRLGRLWNYGGLAAGMFGGAINESLRRISGGGGEGPYMLSAANMDRLVSKLSRMRGAALKLGQMISFQDSKMLPPAIQEVLQRVQDRADYMPPSQRNKVLISNLGREWREFFSEFEEKPLAAASIGQVHKAVLKSNGVQVAVKIQYPGVADSIDSDLDNLTLLLTASRLLPKGLFLDKTIENARTELAWECDYIREADCVRRFQELLADESDVFRVPRVFPEASGKQVLTMEFMEGIAVTRIHSFKQAQKDWIGTQILRLSLREITEFKFMQTDPNWTNFLFNSSTNKLELLDFGASREYPTEFITRYTKLLAAASRSDREKVRDLSIELGYLTGHESKAMLDAHLASVLTLAEPFLGSSPEVYDFKDQTITERVKALIPVMIRERLAPPPEETYSLHRKLSGAFLLCAKLGSRVRCRELFEGSIRNAGIP